MPQNTMSKSRNDFPLHWVNAEMYLFRIEKQHNAGDYSQGEPKNDHYNRVW
jgi:hypothetical protein